MNELIREQLRVILARQLPLKVPDQVCSDLGPYLELITTAYQERLNNLNLEEMVPDIVFRKT